MKKKLLSTLTAILAAVLVAIVPSYSTFVSAQTQDVPYKIVEAGNDNVSIADGYFVKPAKYTVENGKNYVQFSLRDAQYVKSLSGPYGAVQVLSEDDHSRVVKMQVDDLSKPVTLEMHIVVPEEVAGMKYDHQHKARAIFDTSAIKNTGQTSETTDSSKTNDEKQVDNPKTSDNTPLIMYSMLMLGAVAVLIIIWKRRPANN